MLRDMPLYVFRDSRMSKRLFLFPPLKRLVLYHKVCHFSCLLSALMRIDTVWSNFHFMSQSAFTRSNNLFVVRGNSKLGFPKGAKNVCRVFCK